MCINGCRVMDGLACTSQIREWEQNGLLRGHVPIIAVTANARSEQIATLLAAGMVSHSCLVLL
jgi:CheY-like chemotaxis protein